MLCLRQPRVRGGVCEGVCSPVMEQCLRKSADKSFCLANSGSSNHVQGMPSWIRNREGVYSKTKVALVISRRPYRMRFSVCSGFQQADRKLQRRCAPLVVRTAHTAKSMNEELRNGNLHRRVTVLLRNISYGMFCRLPRRHRRFAYHDRSPLRFYHERLRRWRWDVGYREKVQTDLMALALRQTNLLRAPLSGAQNIDWAMSIND